MGSVLLWVFFFMSFFDVYCHERKIIWIIRVHVCFRLLRGIWFPISCLQHLVWERSRTPPYSKVLWGISHLEQILPWQGQLLAIVPYGTRILDSIACSRWTFKLHCFRATKFDCNFLRIHDQVSLKVLAVHLVGFYLTLVDQTNFCTPFRDVFGQNWSEVYINGAVTNLNQSLRTVKSLNSSLFVVNAGFQDYFSGLYNQATTLSEALDISRLWWMQSSQLWRFDNTDYWTSTVK